MMLCRVEAVSDAMQSQFAGTTSDDTWVVLQTTSMGLYICTHYSSLNFHLGVHYIYNVQYMSHTPVRHSVSIKVI